VTPKRISLLSSLLLLLAAAVVAGAPPAPPATSAAPPPAAASTAAPADNAAVLNRVVLRVNDEIATLYDYRQRKAELIQDINRREQDAAERKRLLEQAGEIVYKDMFDELLLKSRADQTDVTITDQQLDQAVRQTREGSGIKDDQQYAAALAQAGLTEEKLRDQLRNNLRLREVLGREVNSKVKVSEEDQRRYYRKHLEEFRVPDQIQVREVVVLEQKTPNPEERARLAKELRDAIASGKAMADAVEPYHAKGLTSGVSDLGWVSPHDLDPTLEAAVWKLPKGAMSEPVVGRGGLHLLQVADRRESHVKPFTEVAAAIQAKEEDRVYRQKLAEFMADLQKQSLIVATPPPEAAGYRRLVGTPGTEEERSSLGTGTPAPASPKPGPMEEGVPAGMVGKPAPQRENAPMAPTEPGALPSPKPVDTTPPPVAPPPDTPPLPPAV